ncbi:MAG: hypothetical protein VKQ33_07915 [Candidatus Sericytochromatia bacterium]|nr:hypothetical protein [Candidatus Sericytochromatia bacterium]
MAQKCFFHPRVDATAQCESCKLSICDQCELEDLCRDCRNRRRAIADRQRRAHQAQEAGEPPPAPAGEAEGAGQPWTYDPTRVSYRKIERPQPVVHRRPGPRLLERLAALDPRLWGVAAAVAVLGLGAARGWWGGEAAPPPSLAVATPTGSPAFSAPLPSPRRTSDAAARAVWEEAERLAQRQVAGVLHPASPVASPAAASRADARTGAPPSPGPRPTQGAGRPAVPLAPPAGPTPHRSAATGPAGATRAGHPALARSTAQLRVAAARWGRPGGRRLAPAGPRARWPRAQAQARRVPWPKARRQRAIPPPPLREERPGAPLVTRWED